MLANYQEISYAYERAMVSPILYEENDFVDINSKLSMPLSDLRTIYNENQLMINWAKESQTNDGVMRSGDALLDDGFMSYNEATNLLTDFNNNQDRIWDDPVFHISSRYALNNNLDFAYNWTQEEFNAMTTRAIRDETQEWLAATRQMHGENWTLYKNFASVYHTPETVRNNGDRYAWNYKWVSESGRELVLTPQGNIVTDTRYFGTYNLENSILKGHKAKDMDPYVIYGSSPCEYLEMHPYLNSWSLY